jgi:hypothetical protein
MLGLDPHGIKAERAEKIDHVGGLMTRGHGGNLAALQFLLGSILAHRCIRSSSG